MENIDNAKRELIDSIPKAGVYILTAFIIWLFTKAVFVPLGGVNFYGGITAAKVMVLISTITILVILFKVLKEVRDICDSIAAFIAYTVDPKAETQEYEIYQKAVRSIVYVFAVVIGFMFFGSLLNEIHPAISGIILIVIFMWAIGTLYTTGMLVSDKIEAKAKKMTAKLVKPGGK